MLECLPRAGSLEWGNEAKGQMNTSAIKNKTLIEAAKSFRGVMQLFKFIRNSAHHCASQRISVSFQFWSHLPWTMETDTDLVFW